MVDLINEKTVTGRSDEHIHYITEYLGIHLGLIEPWQNMYKAARTDGIDIQIASGFRSFKRQQSIFERKLRGSLPVFNLMQQKVNVEGLDIIEKISKILLFTALPGASRHHWGTDIDVYSPALLKGQPLQLEAWEYAHDGPMAKLTCWLDNNMAKFGFYRPYDIYRNGVAPEPWHLSYQPISTKFEQQLSVKNLEKCINESNLLESKSILFMLDTIYQRYIINVSNAVHI